MAKLTSQGSIAKLLNLTDIVWPDEGFGTFHGNGLWTAE
jgi:hypothetical protein